MLIRLSRSKEKLFIDDFFYNGLASNSLILLFYISPQFFLLCKFLLIWRGLCLEKPAEKIFLNLFFLVILFLSLNINFIDARTPQIEAFQVEDDYVYAGISSTFQIISVADPLEPDILSETKLDKRLDFICVRGDVGYLIPYYSNDIFITDISDKTNPIILEEVSTSITEDPVIYDDYLFSYQSWLGINTFHLDTHVTQEIFDFTANNYFGLFVQDDYLYCTLEAGGYDWRFMIIDISDLNNCTLVGEESFHDHPYLNIVVEGNFAYALYSNQVGIFDVSNKSDPIFIGTYESNDYLLDLEIVDNTLYLAGYGGLDIVDVSNPHAPTRLSLTSSLINLYQLYFNDDYLFATKTTRESFHIIDVTDKENPEVVNTCNVWIPSIRNRNIIISMSVVAFLAIIVTLLVWKREEINTVRLAQREKRLTARSLGMRNIAANVSICFLIVTLILYCIPCFIVNFFGFGFAFFAFLTGFLGLRKDYLKRRAIICLIVTLVLTIAIVIARSVIGWFAW